MKAEGEVARDLSEDELQQKARELSEEVFNLRFQLSMAWRRTRRASARRGATGPGPDDPPRADARGSARLGAREAWRAEDPEGVVVSDKMRRRGWS